MMELAVTVADRSDCCTPLSWRCLEVVVGITVRQLAMGGTLVWLWMSTAAGHSDARRSEAAAGEGSGGAADSGGAGSGGLLPGGVLRGRGRGADLRRR